MGGRPAGDDAGGPPRRLVRWHPLRPRARGAWFRAAVEKSWEWGRGRPTGRPTTTGSTTSCCRRSRSRSRRRTCSPHAQPPAVLQCERHVRVPPAAGDLGRPPAVGARAATAVAVRRQPRGRHRLQVPLRRAARRRPPGRPGRCTIAASRPPAASTWAPTTRDCPRAVYDRRHLRPHRRPAVRGPPPGLRRGFGGLRVAQCVGRRAPRRAGRRDRPRGGAQRPGLHRRAQLFAHARSWRYPTSGPDAASSSSCRARCSPRARRTAAASRRPTSRCRRRRRPTRRRRRPPRRPRRPSPAGHRGPTPRRAAGGSSVGSAVDAASDAPSTPPSAPPSRHCRCRHRRLRRRHRRRRQARRRRRPRCRRLGRPRRRLRQRRHRPRPRLRRRRLRCRHQARLRRRLRRRRHRRHLHRLLAAAVAATAVAAA